MLETPLKKLEEQSEESKEYKTPEELVEILKGRGMDFENEEQISAAIKAFKRGNYYNIINGYKNLFLDNNTSKEGGERYREGVKFSDIYAVYAFDRELREIYFKYLLRIESLLRAVISNEFSEKHGYDDYLVISNFDSGINDSTDSKDTKNNSSREKLRNINYLFAGIQEEIAEKLKYRNKFITHYALDYGYLPLWVLVNIFTFAKLKSFYSLLKEDDKTNIANQLDVSSETLYNYMEMCTQARNLCAHGERFFDTKLRRSLNIENLKSKETLQTVYKDDCMNVKENNSVYAIAIIFSEILDNEELDGFVDDMKKSFERLGKRADKSIVKDVMSKMGYCDSWENIFTDKQW